MIDVALVAIFCVVSSSGCAFVLALRARLKFYGWVIILMTAISLILLCTEFQRAGFYVLWSAQFVTGLMYLTIWRKRLLPWCNHQSQ